MDSFKAYQKGKYFRALLKHKKKGKGIIPSIFKLGKVFFTSFLPRFKLNPIMGPLYVGLDITYKCNCKCLFCSRWKKHDKVELSTPEILNLCEEFRKADVYTVAVAGGEPLIHPDILEILKCLKTKNIRINLCTNGFYLDEMADDLISIGVDQITVSMDSSIPGNHDKFRGSPGLYQKAARGINQILEKREKTPRTAVRMTLHEQNFHEISQFLTQWKNRVDLCMFQPLHIGLNNLYMIQDSSLQPVKSVRQFKKLFQENALTDNFCNANMPKYLEDPKFFSRFPCYAGYLFARIDPYGNVFPCVEQNYYIDNIRENSFSDIWYSPQFKRFRKEILPGKKCSCWYNNAIILNSYMWRIHKKLGVSRLVQLKST
jgi:MoaA/NifB/PqqE/SkfB family radical SAM enzyme